MASQILEANWEVQDSAHVEGGYKDWNILLCCVTNGSYDPTGGAYPLNRCFFGGTLLVQEGSIVNLVMPQEVRDVADALETIDKEEFRARYMRLSGDLIHRENWAKVDQEYQYDLWIRLNKLKRFYRRAAIEARAVMFYTDDPLNYFLVLPQNLWVAFRECARVRLDRRVLPPTVTITSPR